MGKWDRDYYAMLMYGPPGAGKTTFPVSGMIDIMTGEPVVREGTPVNARLIQFGRESNPALRVPDQFTTVKGKGGREVSLRFANPSLDNMDWLNQFSDVMDSFLKAARQGTHLDLLAVDGMSEFDLLYEEVFARQNEGSTDKFAKWDALMRDLFSIMQRLDPEELGCHIVVTARVMERKKAIKNSAGKEITSGDPDYMNFDYYPSLRGGFRLHFPHYFNLMGYMEADVKVFEGKSQEVNLLHIVRDGDYFVKNQWRHLWTAKGLPNEIVNPSFWQVVDVLDSLTGRRFGATTE